MSTSKTNVVRKLYPDGRVEQVAEAWTLAQLQAFVGGYIEFVKANVPHRALIINEEGLLDNLPVNLEATRLCHKDVYRLGPLRGNVLLVKH